MSTASHDGAYGRIAFAATAAERALEAGGGIVRLAPAWVPREFCTPGRRIRLHPDDYYPFGPDRGGVDERWLASAIRADNGPLTGPVRGPQPRRRPGGSPRPVRRVRRASRRGPDRVATVGRVRQVADVLEVLRQPAGPALPLPPDGRGRRQGRQGRQAGGVLLLAAHEQHPRRPAHLLPGSPAGDDAEPVARAAGALRAWAATTASPTCRGATARSSGPAGTSRVGVLHAPASICTYEPQAASDVFCMCESWSNNREVPAGAHVEGRAG